jgi:manganese/zinc/iron transport system substrate-binding protein
MIADLVRQLGGSHVEVTQMMQAGVDPHSYRASAGDVQKMQQADIVFHNGLHLEGKMSDVFEQMAQRVRTVAVTRDLSPATDLRKAEEGYEGTHDPHVWFSVRLWSKVAETVCNALCDLDPAHAAEFRQNTSAYQKQLTALDEEVRVKAQLVPESRRKLVTAHDAFYYFGQAYGFEVRGLQGVSTNDEPNTRRVQELARYIAENKIPAIFGESSVPDRSIEAVQQASKKGWKHDVRLLGGELFSDSLDDADKPAGTYIGMIRHNVDTIVNALK